MVNNAEETLSKKVLRISSKLITPLSHGYLPELDSTEELKADGLKYYQEMIV